MSENTPTTIGAATLHLGDCLHVLRTMPDNSVDSIVTDPPYGLSFMGKKWDYDVPAVEVWAECLRVLKPGGHLLAFAGTRTQHRMAVRIEDAGFEIRDMIAWVYGSGFPKSLDVSKAIDKAAGAEREIVGLQMRVDGRVPELEPGNKPCMGYGGGLGEKRKVTAPATGAARQWQGWGTALKPALEQITMARKPFAGPVYANVLQYGTGALNIDDCRIAVDGETNPSLARRAAAGVSGKCGLDMNSQQRKKEGLPAYTRDIAQYVQGNPGEALGRWPANLIHDGSGEVLAGFPQSKSTGGLTPGVGSKTTPSCWAFGDRLGAGAGGYGDQGSAARFFYTPKASGADRQEGNTHPTVKPTDLMQYLCRLVTPPGGVVLDPYMGSGSTGKAALIEGFAFVGIEREPQYFDIAKNRIRHAACADGLFAEAT